MRGALLQLAGMPEKRIRFGVRNDRGRRAATWTLILKVSPTRPEVYLCVRNLGGTLKTSFHASGKWRHAYVKAKFDELFSGVENAPEDRCIDEWSRPAEHGPGITWALRILVPPVSARTRIEAESAGNIHWIGLAQKPRWTEIGIFFLSPKHATVGPPVNATDFGVVATEALGNGEFVHVVHQSIEAPSFPETAPMPVRFFAGHTPADILSGDFRTLMFTSHTNGIRVIVDAPVEVSWRARLKVWRWRFLALFRRFLLFVPQLPWRS